jgi:hypothetical protein
MLNPSTADALADDPTIRKCRGFSERLGYGRLCVGNLFAYRATDPADLIRAAKGGVDVVGPSNDTHLCKMLGQSDAVVLAWGGNGKRFQDRVRAVRARLAEWSLPKLGLGTCADGSPWHPLMIAYDVGLEGLRGGCDV